MINLYSFLLYCNVIAVSGDIFVVSKPFTGRSKTLLDVTKVLCELECITLKTLKIMKSLDLQQIGLQELTTVETRSVDGGCLFTCTAVAVFIVGAIVSTALLAAFD